jgi:hypothetical protein
MPTANVRYGRPKGSGLDDRQRLESIAALLAANPKLKPTTAIRSLGVEDPSAIRRLRDKFRIEQAKLMADASRATRRNGARRSRVISNENTPAPGFDRPSAPPMPAAQYAPEAPPATASGAYFAVWCDLGLCTLNTAVEGQSALAQLWLGLPAVSMALRGQLVVNAVAVAILTRNAPRRRRLH